MEEDILKIYLDNISKIPIAQNILITNIETSYEEMQAFLNRAILCRYNVLFVIEINESFSEYQQRYLNRFMDELLTYKNEEYNNSEKKNIGKVNTSEYMDSCLVLVYNNNTESSLNYIIKLYNPLNLELRHELNISRKELNKNVHVIKSEICGLGKTEKIRKEIENKKKTYSFSNWRKYY